MNIKTRLEKLEQHQILMDSTEEIPESLSPREQYMQLINVPIKANKAKPSRTYTPDEAYAALIGKDHELS